MALLHQRSHIYAYAFGNYPLRNVSNPLYPIGLVSLPLLGRKGGKNLYLEKIFYTHMIIILLPPVVTKLLTFLFTAASTFDSVYYILGIQ